MDTKEFLTELNAYLSHLYAICTANDELDFAASLSGEFRGMQDAGWSTKITAHEVFEEINEYAHKDGSRSKAELRINSYVILSVRRSGRSI